MPRLIDIAALSSNSSSTPAFNTFRALKPKEKIQDRAKFDLARRQEVYEVRKSRACLRCSLLKIGCSPEPICTRCSDLVHNTYEKTVLSFSGCIRTRLAEVSIFEDAIHSAQGQPSLLKTQKLALKSINLNFTSQTKLNLPKMVDDVVKWLNTLQISTAGSIQTISSSNFAEIIEPHIGIQKMLAFQRMLYTRSVAYTLVETGIGDQLHVIVSQLRQVVAIIGHNFLHFLDNQLRPQSLNNCSREDLQALFLLAVGTLIAIGYADPVDDDFDSSDKKYEINSTTHQTQSEATRNHLCQILAHYIIYLGSTLDLPITNSTKQFVPESAANLWRKERGFEWMSLPVVDSVHSGYGISSLDSFEASDPMMKARYFQAQMQLKNLSQPLGSEYSASSTWIGWGDREYGKKRLLSVSRAVHHNFKHWDAE